MREGKERLAVNTLGYRPNPLGVGETLPPLSLNSRFVLTQRAREKENRTESGRKKGGRVAAVVR